MINPLALGLLFFLLGCAEQKPRVIAVRPLGMSVRVDYRAEELLRQGRLALSHAERRLATHPGEPAETSLLIADLRKAVVCAIEDFKAQHTQASLTRMRSAIGALRDYLEK